MRLPNSSNLSMNVVLSAAEILAGANCQHARKNEKHGRENRPPKRDCGDSGIIGTWLAGRKEQNDTSQRVAVAHGQNEKRRARNFWQQRGAAPQNGSGVRESGGYQRHALPRLRYQRELFSGRRGPWCFRVLWR